jgi:myo-inositol-1-phosphate synthase
LTQSGNIQIAPAEGKLGVLIPGMGAVTTTFLAGLEAIKRGLGKPVGSLTQLGTVRLGKRTDGHSPAIKDFVPLAKLEDLVVGTWDIFEDNAYEAAVNAGVLDMPLLEQLKGPLEAVTPMKAVFDQSFVKRINGPNVMPRGSKMDYAERVMDDIRRFKEKTGASRLTMIWCGSTEVFHEPAPVHASLKNFECGLLKNDPEISPSQIYAYAALKSGVPYANGAPHMTTDMPALLELARNRNVPVSGKDYKSGQTFMKTLMAPGLKSRLLGVSGWFSTNILGNRDGEVLDDPGSFRSKEVSKSSALEYILQEQLYPDLYKDVYHKVRIEYYRRGATLKKAGTTSTFSGGWATPCRSRLTSYAAIRFWPPPWCWTWCCSWTWHSAPACEAFRNGFRSTSRRPCTLPKSTQSMTYSSSS